MPNTWKVTFHRVGARWPTLFWFYGDTAEKEARKKAAEVAEANLTPRLFERVDGAWRQR